jgi:MFS family permease
MDTETDDTPETAQDQQATQFGYYALYLTRFSLGLGLTMLATFIPEYSKLLEATPYWIGLFTTGFSLSATLTVLPMGWVSDRYDKRLVLLLGLVSSVAAYIIFLFVDSVQMLTFGRILQGLSMSMAALTVLSLVGAMAGEDERGKRIGTLNAVRNLSSGIGSIAGGWLYGLFGFAVPYTLLIIMTIGAILLTLRYVPRDETRVRGVTFAPLVRNQRIQAMAAFRVSYSFAVMLVRTFVPIYVGVTLGLTALQVGIVIAAEKLVNMAGQRYTGIISDRRGRFPLILLGGGLYALGAGLIPLQTTMLGLCLVNAFLGLADSFREPASMALFADEGKKAGGIASSFSVRSIIWRPGSVLVPMIGGAFMAGAGIQWVFYAAVGFSIAAVAGIPLMLSVQDRLERKVLMS